MESTGGFNRTNYLLDGRASTKLAAETGDLSKLINDKEASLRYKSKLGGGRSNSIAHARDFETNSHRSLKLAGR